MDWSYAKGTFEKYPNARIYKDYRKMFDEMYGQIDAVVIATPDHTHAIIAAEAMRRGMHVYLQKPLTHSVSESRLLTQIAREYRVATQMGNQGNSDEGIRQVCEWIWDGAIGEISEAHAWTNRPIWPQGLERPLEDRNHPADTGMGPVPRTGPLTTLQSSLPPLELACLVGFRHRRPRRYGLPYLRPGLQSTETGQSRIYLYGSSTQVNTESAPKASVVHYEFPDRGEHNKLKLVPVKVTWYDGGLLPPRPAELKDGELMGDWSGGCLFVGTKGKLLCDSYGRNPRLLPEELDKDYKRPEPYLRRIEKAMDGGHETGLDQGMQGKPRQPRGNQLELRLCRPDERSGGHGQPGRPPAGPEKKTAMGCGKNDDPEYLR